MKSDDPKHLRAAIPAALPPQAISEEVLLEKYAKGDERTIDDVRRRVARALAAVEAPDKRAFWEDAFYRAQQNGFILGGRINSAAPWCVFVVTACILRGSSRLIAMIELSARVS